MNASHLEQKDIVLIPAQTYGQIFQRFLKFGIHAWGGPVAQIAMIRHELVEQEKWISAERFNRVLAVYQALPGPEAHELCVYFGMIAKGRLGAFLAGLGFMLPGFVLMLLFSWLYTLYGMQSTSIQSFFHGVQAAVLALMLRAVFRIGQHALSNSVLWGLAVSSGIAAFFGVNFFAILLLCAVIFAAYRGWKIPLGLIPLVAGTGWFAGLPSTAKFFYYGLRTGLLTFGGAYTAIPFLQHDAVQAGGWMTSQQFLDGVALSSVMPGPLIIFSTFVGYLGGGFIGALALTAGVFLPAFSFTMLGHNFLEKLVENKSAHAFLDGIMAGVVGLISAAFLGLMRENLIDLPSRGIFLIALLIFFRLKNPGNVGWVMLICGGLGWLTQKFCS